jgi:uncharacterized protein YbjQ (UPF0145 family)
MNEVYDEARGRAAALGANAIVGMRIESLSFMNSGSFSLFHLYGTAIKYERSRN